MDQDENILSLCYMLGANEELEPLLLSLIETTRSSFQRRMKPGVSPQDCGTAFPLAVALAAMDSLDQAIGGGDVSSFTAGEVSMQLRETAGDRRRNQAERLLAPWLSEEGFAFRGVRG